MILENLVALCLYDIVGLGLVSLLLGLQGGVDGFSFFYFLSQVSDGRLKLASLFIGLLLHLFETFAELLDLNLVLALCPL